MTSSEAQLSDLTAEPWRSLDPALVEYVALPVEDVAEVAREVAAALSQNSTSGPIGEIDQVMLDIITGGCLMAHNEFLKEVSQPKAVTDRSVFRDMGRVHQQSGRGIGEMLLFFRVAGHHYWHRIVRQNSAELSSELVAEMSLAVFTFFYDMCAAAVEAHFEADLEKARGFHAMRDRLLEVVLEAAPPDEDRLAAVSRAAQWSVPDRLAVAITERADIGSSQAIPRTVLVGRVHDQTVLLIPDADLERMRKLLKRTGHGLAAMGPVGPPSAARDSYDLAARLLDVGRRRSDPDGTILTLDGNEIDLAVLADPDVARRGADALLAPFNDLDEERRKVLLETLSGWLARPDQPLAVARQLHIHVQTVRYRLRQLRDMLGDDLDDPVARARLAFALNARRLLEPTQRP